MNCQVVKVGGSLFDLPDLQDRISNWLQRQSASSQVLIAGGGPLCNAIRRWHALYSLDEEFCHEECLAMMGMTARLLARVTGLPLIADFERLNSLPGPLVFDCSHWASELETVPKNWDVTSDSLSAILASQLEAELVLFRSTSGTAQLDRYFRKASRQLETIQYVNLRDVSWSKLQ